MTRKRLFLSGLSLLVFILLAGCGNPYTGGGMPPGDPWHGQAVGTSRFIFLDEDQKNVALFIEGNEAASKVSLSAIAGTGGGDDVVYVVNDGTKTMVSFLFHEGQTLPWQIVIQRDGMADVEAALTITSRAAPQRGTVDFSDGQSLTNIRLYVTPHEENPGLTEDQNNALGHIHTALNVFESISRAKDLNSELYPVFRDAAVISAILAENGGGAPTEGPSTPTHLGFWSSAWDYFFGGSSSPLPPPPPPQLQVTIKDPDEVQIDPKAVYYLDHGEETYFDFTFTNFTAATNVTANLYDSGRVKYLNHYYPTGSIQGNAVFFDVYKGNGDPLVGKFTQTYRVKVKRNELEGYINEGYVQLVIFFGQNTIVNGNNTGVLFHEPGKSGPVLNKSVFVLHFNVFPDKPYPW
jgi:hypothetical protein